MSNITRTATTGLAAIVSVSCLASAQSQYAWRYYRPSNTGIQGDSCEAIYVGADGDPWIGGYDPGFEEGGIARLVQAENRWVNISNVDYAVIGHPQDTGTSRVSDIVKDASGKLWMATGRGALVFDPAAGPASLVRYDPSNSSMPGGWCEDVDIAPDGTIWFASRGAVWGPGGINRFNPATGAWTFWDFGAEALTIRPKLGGGYVVWTSVGNNGGASVFDSATQTWATPPYSGEGGQIAGLPGKDSTDDAGNFWALRATTPGDYHGLDYQRPDGTWVSPPPPFTGVTFDLWAFRAFGDRQALLVDANSHTWRFDGASWTDLGQWREGAYTYAADIDAGGNVWVCGVGGAARRDATTGQWQRYRVTNTSQYDFFTNDLTIDPAGGIYACANAGTGVGGMVRFDGVRWIGFNEAQYGLGEPWPFPTDSSQAVYVRPSNGRVVVNPTFNHTHQFDGSSWTSIPGGSDTVKGYVEDSLGRLWGLGEYFSLGTYVGGTFHNVGIAAWGEKIQVDPDRGGTVWAHAGFEIVRTDGTYRFSRTIESFPELNPQSDNFTGLAVDHDGIAWVGAWTQFTSTGSVLIRLDAKTGQYQIFQHDLGWPFPGEHVRPLAVTPDGKLWMQYDSEYPSEDAGLCWYDGANVGTFPAPPGGTPQWGGLPHSAIKDLEVKLIPGGYELWMSCLSRGIAVLSVTEQGCPADFDGSGFVDTEDFDAFVRAFEIGTQDADFDGSGFVDTDDFDGFVRAFEIGC